MHRGCYHQLLILGQIVCTLFFSSTTKYLSNAAAVGQLNDAHRAALEASVPEFEFRFNALDDVHAEDVLWADVVLGNAPVSMISQNKHIEWFQSNSAGARD